MDMATRFPEVRQRIAVYQLYCKMWNRPCPYREDELDEIFRFLNTTFTKEFEKFVKESLKTVGRIKQSDLCVVGT